MWFTDGLVLILATNGLLLCYTPLQRGLHITLMHRKPPSPRSVSKALGHYLCVQIPLSSIRPRRKYSLQRVHLSIGTVRITCRKNVSNLSLWLPRAGEMNHGEGKKAVPGPSTMGSLSPRLIKLLPLMNSPYQQQKYIEPSIRQHPSAE